MGISKKNRLIKDIKEILETEYLTPENIVKDSEDDDEATIRLDITKDRLVRIVVISDYLLVNETFDVMIRDFFFTKKFKRQTKREKIFNQHVLERLTVINKLELLNEFKKIPEHVKNFIHVLNGLRNCFAHSFFPEDRRREKPRFKKKDIYKIEVLKEYKEDYDKAMKFLMKEAWGVDPDDI